MAMTAISAFFIITTTFSVVNDTTVDRSEYSRMSKHQSYSECRKDITPKKIKFAKKRNENRGKYVYIYKTIQCEKRKILEYNNIFKK